jgi:hypothetical protein
MAREEVKLGGCLLLAKLSFPSNKIYICGLCPNKSNDTGDLGKLCKAPDSTTQK